MSKYNGYARQLDAAFKKARQEYVESWEKLQAAQKLRDAAQAWHPEKQQGDLQRERQRAELYYLEAEQAFKEAERRVWAEFNRKRAELRAKLESEITENGTMNPDALDQNGLEILKMGGLTADDFYSLADRYDDNPTMLRLVAKYAKEAADDMEGAQRGALYQLAQVCGNGQGKPRRAWDELSHVVDYCSGQVRQGEAPQHRVNMGKWWEQLSGEAVENF